ncbi:hypothetical protein CEXT_509491 [Caerostris extrusa]|uniref:Uncharacterized protein n=1 Tax=Caerostris extrusa TaxID=172846 RepID=A0AAV4YGE2_CAEEX|nr:hypothetical protein CEXT_509491 [Caerostris extrusa]
MAGGGVLCIKFKSPPTSSRPQLFACVSSVSLIPPAKLPICAETPNAPSISNSSNHEPQLYSSDIIGQLLQKRNCNPRLLLKLSANDCRMGVGKIQP